jgi:hypothetical protein
MNDYQKDAFVESSEGEETWGMRWRDKDLTWTERAWRSNRYNIGTTTVSWSSLMDSCLTSVTSSVLRPNILLSALFSYGICWSVAHVFINQDRRAGGYTVSPAYSRYHSWLHWQESLVNRDPLSVRLSAAALVRLPVVESEEKTERYIYLLDPNDLMPVSVAIKGPIAGQC